MFAFTLAEVTIVLGIIGIIAALTIPNLVNNTSYLQYRSAWKKTYSTLVQVHESLEADNKLPYDSYNEYRIDFASYLKTISVCSSGPECWHPAGEWFTVNNVAITDPTYSNPPWVHVLGDGTLVAFFTNSSYPPSPLHTGGIVSYSNSPFPIMVDVNGYKKPNRIGYDIYALEAYGDGIVAAGSINSYNYTSHYVCGQTDPTSNEPTYSFTCSSDALLDKQY